MKILKNNRGFSLIEILAVIAILSILMGIGILAYTRYRTSATENTYKLIEKNVISAAENYFVDNINATSVSIDKLVEESYLETVIDPVQKNNTCTGTVIKIEDNESNNPDAIQESNFKVTIICGEEKRCMMTNSELSCNPDDEI